MPTKICFHCEKSILPDIDAWARQALDLDRQVDVHARCFDHRTDREAHPTRARQAHRARFGLNPGISGLCARLASYRHGVLIEDPPSFEEHISEIGESIACFSEIHYTFHLHIIRWRGGFLLYPNAGGDTLWFAEESTAREAAVLNLCHDEAERAYGESSDPRDIHVRRIVRILDEEDNRVEAFGVVVHLHCAQEPTYQVMGAGYGAVFGERMIADEQTALAALDQHMMVLRDCKEDSEREGQIARHIIDLMDRGGQRP